MRANLSRHQNHCPLLSSPTEPPGSSGLSHPVWIIFLNSWAVWQRLLLYTKKSFISLWKHQECKCTNQLPVTTGRPPAGVMLCSSNAGFCCGIFIFNCPYILTFSWLEKLIISPICSCSVSLNLWILFSHQTCFFLLGRKGKWENLDSVQFQLYSSNSVMLSLSLIISSKDIKNRPLLKVQGLTFWQKKRAIQSAQQSQDFWSVGKSVKFQWNLYCIMMVAFKLLSFNGFLVRDVKRSK